MENTKATQKPSLVLEEKSSDIDELISTLPRTRSWIDYDFYQYEGFWYPSIFIRNSISFQRHFQAKNTDIILASFPKCGTTWLKSLAFTITNRSRYSLRNNPLLLANPHDLVPFLDTREIQFSNLENLPTPRLLSVHSPFSSLPHSMMNSSCRIIYICRNPFDQFISHWHFLLRLKADDFEAVTFEEAFDMFCNGKVGFGPFWDHVLSYWKASLKQPHKILFLKYEDLKKDIIPEVKKMAEFLGCPFSQAEDNQGVIDEISTFCSFHNMKNLEVNKNGQTRYGLRNEVFFRKGKVGDSNNYLTSSMLERLKKIMEEKFDGSGLTLEYLN